MDSCLILKKFLSKHGTTQEKKLALEKHLKDAKVEDYFLAIVCGDMIENSKPAPDIYMKTCEMISAEPKECYALEDSKNYGSPQADTGRGIT